jgi:hypothetical protein
MSEGDKVAWARGAPQLFGAPKISAKLPFAILLGDAERAFGLLLGSWQR